MKSVGFTSFCLLLSIASPSAARADATAASQCVGFFESWASGVKTSLSNELKVARNLGFEKRSDSDASRPAESLLAAAKDLCGRLSGLKPLPSNGSNIDTCVAAFGKWEDEMDTAYTMAVFEKHLPENTGEEKKLVPAQDIARREATLGKRLCHLMDPIH